MGVHIFCTGGEDYVDLNDTLTFRPGERTKVVTVTILNDFLLEENETFHVSITADNDRVTVARSNSTVIIKDTDGRDLTQSKLAVILSLYFTVSLSSGGWIREGELQGGRGHRAPRGQHHQLHYIPRSNGGGPHHDNIRWHC